MKINYKFILSFTLLVYFLGVFSCKPCNNSGLIKQIVTDLTWEFVEIENLDSFQSGERLIRKSQTKDSVNYQDFALDINTITQMVSSEKKTFNFGLIQQAYACEPAIPIILESIIELEITSDQEYDKDHPAGSNLADLFEISILDQINQVTNSGFMDLTAFLQNDPKMPFQLTLKLKSPPAVSKNFKFKFYLLLFGNNKSGTFEIETSKINVLR